MQILITLALTFSSLIAFTQKVSSTIDHFGSVSNTLKAGSCLSPDGPNTEIASSPPDYQYLYDNGYCLYTYNTTSAFTACFTVTSPGTDIEFNAGYSTSCNNVSFNNFRFYDASCTLIGSGLTYSGLTPGADYTWCLDMRAFGGPSCNGFDYFCPYWINTTPLSVELLYFNNKCPYVEWATASETNSDYFQIEYSIDYKKWELKTTVESNKDCAYTSYYKEPADMIGYYRLSEVDRDGKITTYDPIYVSCVDGDVQPIKFFNLLGQDVHPQALPVGSQYFILYSNGEVVNTIKTIK